MEVEVGGRRGRGEKRGGKGRDAKKRKEMVGDRKRNEL